MEYDRAGKCPVFMSLAVGEKWWMLLRVVLSGSSEMAIGASSVL